MSDIGIAYIAHHSSLWSNLELSCFVKAGGGCLFTQWVDPPMTSRASIVIEHMYGVMEKIVRQTTVVDKANDILEGVVERLQARLNSLEGCTTSNSGEIP